MRLLIIFSVLSVVTAGTTLAHGPQLQITNHGGKIATHDVLLDGPYGNATPARSVYVMPVLKDGGIWYSRPNTAERPIIGGPEYYSGPGLAFGSQVATAAAFASGENFLLNFTDRLLYWSGAEFVDPGTEEVRAFRGSPTAMSATATTSDTSPFESLDFPEISSDYTEDAHNSARFQFLGDGSDPTVAPDDGIYLLSLSLSSTQVGMNDSDEFFFVLHMTASEDEISAAVAALGYSESAVQYLGQVVPELSTLVYSFLVAGAWVAHRRRK